MNTTTTFSVDDEFSNQIAAGLSSYSEAVQVAKRYLCAHPDAPCVEIYEDSGGEGCESWILDREEVVS